MKQMHIITGAPGTGKTSIINELKKRGYNCSDEISRKIISEQIKINGEILPWKNQIAFENKVAKMRTQQYLSIPKNRICFFDRSAIDCIAYLKLSNLEITSEIIKEVKKCNFNKIVFYTPVWKEIYVTDKERKESINQAQKIEKSIINTYQSEGYKLIPIPKISIKERANFIVSNT